MALNRENKTEKEKNKINKEEKQKLLVQRSK